MSKAWLLLLGALAACSNTSADRARAERTPDLRTLTSAREYAGEKNMSATVEFAAGRLSLTPAPSGTLYHAVLSYDQRQFQPEVSYEDGALRVGMRGDNVKIHGGSGHGNQLNLQLGPDAPLDLDLKFAAGESNIELGGLKVERLKLATGAARGRLSISRPTLGRCQDLDLQVGAAHMDVVGLGHLSPEAMSVQGGVGDVGLDFSGAWRNDATAKIDMGLGSLRLDVPRDVGLRVHKSSMLAHFEAPDMTRQGDIWSSAGYESARHHLDIEIDAAFGSIRVNWLAAGAATAAPADTGSSF